MLVSPYSRHTSVLVVFRCMRWLHISDVDPEVDTGHQYRSPGAMDMETCRYAWMSSLLSF